MTNNRNPLYSAVRYALAAGLVTSFAGVSAPAVAQDEDAAELERIEVTGSRIKRTDIEGAQPVFVIQREDIERTGLTNIGDLLQDLPSAGAALNTQFNNGGTGATFVDLRNLGSNRVLVLLNGRRIATAINTIAGGQVDLNNIPIAVVKRIEVLKDGASAIYGSDAIAGVINIITRDDFQGAQANAQIGEYDEGDGQVQSYDFSIGAVGDRSSVFFNASYVQADPVFAGDRTISAEPQFGTGNRLGSSGTPSGRFFLFDEAANTFVTRNADGSPFGATDFFNFAPANYLLTPQERTAIYAQARYDLTDNIGFQVEALYNERESSQLLAPTPLFLGLVGSGPAADIFVDPDFAFNPFGETVFALGRRLVEAGPRVFSQSVDNFRFASGFVGSFEFADRFWDWNVNYLYEKIAENQLTDGLVNVTEVARGLSNDCFDDPDCAPLNVFGAGNISQDALDQILFTAQDTSEKELRNYTGNITGDLFDLPAGPLGFAAGYEYRQEEGFNQPDAIIVSGVTSGNAAQPTSGSITVDEFYVELAVPLLADVPFAERLELSLASRYSDYDLFGDTTNSKIGIQWQPISDLLIRSTYAEAFRAPSVNEAFLGNSDSFPTITDPCSGRTQGTQIDMNCDALGVPDNYIQPNAQIRITLGGNPNLSPETADSLTFGFVYSPSWVDGLDLTVDYYDIEIENTITTTGAQLILNACANSLLLCDNITRGPGGIITDLFNGFTNIGGTSTKGVDFTLSYAFPETPFGYFKTVWDNSYVKDYTNVIPDASGVGFVTQELVGVNLGDTALPRWRSNLDTTWNYGDWEVTYGLQYIHATEESCLLSGNAANNLLLCGLSRADGALADPPVLNDDGSFPNVLGGTTYHDVQVSYNLQAFDTRISVGVDNLFDKGPPISTAAFANSFNVAQYRVPGRFGYIRLTTDF